MHVLSLKLVAIFAFPQWASLYFISVTNFNLSTLWCLHVLKQDVWRIMVGPAYQGTVQIVPCFWNKTYMVIVVASCTNRFCPTKGQKEQIEQILNKKTDIDTPCIHPTCPALPHSALPHSALIYSAPLCPYLLCPAPNDSTIKRGLPASGASTWKFFLRWPRSTGHWDQPLFRQREASKGNVTKLFFFKQVKLARALLLANPYCLIYFLWVSPGACPSVAPKE